MSREQAYFPPKGTKYHWEPKSLQHSPWVGDFVPQVSTLRNMHPLRILLIVSLMNERYFYRVEITDFSNKRTIVEGVSDHALEACLAAESIAERKYIELTPSWVLHALLHNWRPPA